MNALDKSWKEIGGFEVESGTFVIGDPTYIMNSQSWPVEMERLSQAYHDKRSLDGWIPTADDNGVIVFNISGDGYRQVFARYTDSGNIGAILILTSAI